VIVEHTTIRLAYACVCPSPVDHAHQPFVHASFGAEGIAAAPVLTAKKPNTKLHVAGLQLVVCTIIVEKRMWKIELIGENEMTAGVRKKIRKREERFEQRRDLLSW
jgi:hypothetical protein